MFSWVNFTPQPLTLECYATPEIRSKTNRAGHRQVSIRNNGSILMSLKLANLGLLYRPWGVPTTEVEIFTTPLLSGDHFYKPFTRNVCLLFGDIYYKEMSFTAGFHRNCKRVCSVNYL